MTLPIPGTREGSCPGDSGGILMSDDWIPEIQDYRAVQKAVVRGAVKACDGQRFPTIFNRLDEIETLSWINKIVFGKSKSNYVLYPCHYTRTSQLDLGITTGGLERVVSVHNFGAP